MPNRIPGLDLLRAWAIVWVMLFHSYIVGGLGTHLAWLQNDGWMGVDLFFVLSGYLIGGQLLEPLSRGEPLACLSFYRRRALRILPAFLAVLAVYVAWPAAREAPGLSPPWQFLSFTLNLLIDYRHDQAFSHAWSLCVEEQFYLLFPWLAWWLTRRPSARRALAVGLGVAALGIALRGFLWWHQLAPLQGDQRFGLAYLQDVYYPTWCRLDGLLAGVALAAVRIARQALWVRWQAHGGVLLAAGVVCFAAAAGLFVDRFALPATVFGYPLLSLGFGLLVAAAAGAPGRWRIPGIGWLARVSYSLYLSHKLALHAVALLCVEPWQLHGLWAFGLYAGGVLLLGAALHYAVERPFLRWRDRWETGSAAERGAVATAVS